ncbi:hypothetical protein BDY21DRAFT_18277 [Lineolata rhizophorae]|uniref:Uncharacterized protein n=1 Tax=Lineolata rhizophorae TaxID=578093 RepID=A0A6A6P251_9PEZI|nr:hypothetical protein BDY21DRAFT_18277 [Lineolata rhizophorae]
MIQAIGTYTAVALLFHLSPFPFLCFLPWAASALFRAFSGTSGELGVLRMQGDEYCVGRAAAAGPAPPQQVDSPFFVALADVECFRARRFEPRPSSNRPVSFEVCIAQPMSLWSM